MALQTHINDIMMKRYSKVRAMHMASNLCPTMRLATPCVTHNQLCSTSYSAS